MPWILDYYRHDLADDVIRVHAIYQDEAGIITRGEDVELPQQAVAEAAHARSAAVWDEGDVAALLHLEMPPKAPKPALRPWVPFQPPIPIPAPEPPKTGWRRLFARSAR